MATANSSAILAILDTIHDTLAADATLLALCPTIKNFELDAPPDHFIRIGNAVERPWHTFGGTSLGFGWHVEVTVHIYTYRAYWKGELKALEILNRVTALLNFAELSVSGYQTFICEYAAPLTKVLTETIDKVERVHIPAVFTVRVA